MTRKLLLIAMAAIFNRRCIDSGDHVHQMGSSKTNESEPHNAKWAINQGFQDRLPRLLISFLPTPVHYNKILNFFPWDLVFTLDSQEKLISELLNNIQGCSLARQEGAEWNKLISDYFTNAGSLEDSVRDKEDEEFEWDMTDAAGENGGLDEEHEKHNDIQANKNKEVLQLVPFNLTGENDHANSYTLENKFQLTKP